MTQAIITNFPSLFFFTIVTRRPLHSKLKAFINVGYLCSDYKKQDKQRCNSALYSQFIRRKCTKYKPST